MGSSIISARPLTLAGIATLIALAFTSATLVWAEERRAASPAVQDGGSEKKDKKPERELTERQKSIAALFNATKVSFTADGQVVLTYDFETNNEILLEDFAPKIETTKKRIRWGIEDEGLMIADQGNFVHKGMFENTVRIEIRGTSYAMSDKGSYRVVGLFDKRGKTMIGSNHGQQIVKLSGMRIRKGFPTEMPSTRVDEKLNFGFSLEKGIAQSLRAGKPRLDTSKDPKFTKGFEGGRVGLRWSGRTQMCVERIVIAGTLDAKWLAEKLESDS